MIIRTAPFSSVISGLILILATMPLPARASEPAPLRHPLLKADDLRFAVEFAALSVAASASDQWAWDEFPESRSMFSRGLAKVSGDLATPLVFAPALAGIWLAGRVSDHPGLSRSAARITESVVVASAISGVLKYSIGRARPMQSPNDPDTFRPFSGDSSFPSGHATAAFALAAAIDRETRPGWVPFVAYPIAGIVGWSRVRDNRHWLSDVVGGALVGTWVANRLLESRSPATAPGHHATHIGIEPIRGGAGLGLTRSF